MNVTASRDQYGNPVAAYQWDFGDGSLGEGKLVSHRFRTPGSYRVRLFVIDKVGIFGWTEVNVVVEPLSKD